MLTVPCFCRGVLIPEIDHAPFLNKRNGVGVVLPAVSSLLID